MRRVIWWLASYPKSGNTWLRAFIASLVTGRPADINAMRFLGFNAGGRAAFEDALGVESDALSAGQEISLRPRAYEIWAAEAKQPLYCKAHDACHLTPAGEPLFPVAATRGAVYVVRDPRAVAVSLAHYMAIPLDAAIDAMNDRKAAMAAQRHRLSGHLRQRMLSWSEHVESWLGAPFPVHLVRYEDMRSDPQPAFGALAAFLGLGADHELVDAAADAASFSRLRAQELAAGFIEKPQTTAAFFREGSVDGWRGTLTPEQAARVVAAHGTVMRRLGYDVTPAPLFSRTQRAPRATP